MFIYTVSQIVFINSLKFLRNILRYAKITVDPKQYLAKAIGKITRPGASARFDELCSATQTVARVSELKQYRWSSVGADLDDLLRSGDVGYNLRIRYTHTPHRNPESFIIIFCVPVPCKLGRFVIISYRTRWGRRRVRGRAGVT